MNWSVILSRQAVKDLKSLQQAGLAKQAKKLLEVVQKDPFAVPPNYEKLVGTLKGFYSRRINIQHRLVYAVYPETHTVHILRMWTHYE